MDPGIGKRIGEVLHHFRLSQQEMADRIGVAPSSISHIIHGTYLPKYPIIAGIAEHFPEVSLRWLLLGEGPMWEPGSIAEGGAAEEPAAPYLDRLSDLERRVTKLEDEEGRA